MQVDVAGRPVRRGTAPARRVPRAVTLAARRFGLGLVFAFSFGVAAYALLLHGFGPSARRVHPEMRAAFEQHPRGVGTHAFASALALPLGPLQFWPALRSRWPRLHRCVGRVHLGVAVALGGMVGRYMRRHASGGPVTKLGFAGLAPAWLYRGARAFAVARACDFSSHLRWMIRNSALGFAAVTLPLYLPASALPRLDFATAYAAIAWLCWLPDLL
jgi:uncharacterized membrane protein